jgi:hypothetical protein
VLIKIRNIRCEEAKVIARTVEPLMMMMMTFSYINGLFHDAAQRRLRNELLQEAQSSHTVMQASRLTGVF